MIWTRMLRGLAFVGLLASAGGAAAATAYFLGYEFVLGSFVLTLTASLALIPLGLVTAAALFSYASLAENVAEVRAMLQKREPAANETDEPVVLPNAHLRAQMAAASASEEHPYETVLDTLNRSAQGLDAGKRDAPSA